ncbi:MAG: sugar phosphate isomerase/epimerase, partial [Acholeplasmataceae bacterium]|nr:sugar phosphate isomerase/epimerase [Acholeplasmataceae bacterium]
DVQILQMCQWAKEYSVSLECACAGNDFTSADVEAQIAMVSKVLIIASKLESKRIRIFAGFASDSEMDAQRREVMLDALQHVVDAARSLGIIVAVETHGGVAPVEGKVVRHFASYTTRADNWGRLFATGAYMLFDPANLDAAGQIAPELFYQKFADRVGIVHLKDFRHTENGVIPVACGEGGLDWHALHNAMANYEGPALIEYEDPDDVEDGFRRSLEFLKREGF